MSLDKAIQHGKEHRQGYAERGKPGRSDPTCRPHGGGNGWPCPYCERNRLFPWLKLAAEAEERVGEFLKTSTLEGNAGEHQ